MKPLRGEFVLVLAATGILASAAILKHVLLQSAASDLGIFEQYCWLISHFYPPIGTLNMSVTAFEDHKAYILYPLAFLYAPISRAWALLVTQAAALAGSALIVRRLSAQLGHNARMQRVALVVWLLFPTTVTLALCNFHPDVLAVPALLGMVLFSRARRWLPFVACVVVVLGCKETLAFTVMGVGAWMVFTNRRAAGLSTFAIAVLWFCVAQQISRGSPVYQSHMHRYAYLGDSVAHVLSKVVHEPRVLIAQASLDGWVLYPTALLLPVAPWLGRRSLLPMLPALPHFILNILSEAQQQRDISYQYTVGIIPFIVVAALYGMPHSFEDIRYRLVRFVVVVGAFLGLSRLDLFFGRYLTRVAIRAPATDALSEILPDDRVLTTSYLATHVADRRVIDVPREFVTGRLEKFDVLLVNETDPGDSAAPDAERLYVEEARRLRWICHTFGTGVLISCRRPASSSGDRPLEWGEPAL